MGVVPIVNENDTVSVSVCRLDLDGVTSKGEDD